jgi:hypothetical protein
MSLSRPRPARPIKARRSPPLLGAPARATFLSVCLPRPRSAGGAGRERMAKIRAAAAKEPARQSTRGRCQRAWRAESHRSRRSGMLGYLFAQTPHRRSLATRRGPVSGARSVSWDDWTPRRSRTRWPRDGPIARDALPCPGSPGPSDPLEQPGRGPSRPTGSSI